MLRSLLITAAALAVAALCLSLARAAPLPVDDPSYHQRYDHLFKKYSRRWFGAAFDWRWWKAQGIAESDLIADAESWAGAKGVMQIMPATFTEIARRLAEEGIAVTDRSNPGHSIAGGIWYDAWLWELWSDSIHPRRQRLAFTFASYNGGIGRVQRAQERCPDLCNAWAALHPHLPEETRRYVPKIFRLMGRSEP